MLSCKWACLPLEGAKFASSPSLIRPERQRDHDLIVGLISCDHQREIPIRFKVLALSQFRPLHSRSTRSWEPKQKGRVFKSLHARVWVCVCACAWSQKCEEILTDDERRALASSRSQVRLFPISRFVGFFAYKWCSPPTLSKLHFLLQGRVSVRSFDSLSWSLYEKSNGMLLHECCLPIWELQLLLYVLCETHPWWDKTRQR